MALLGHQLPRPRDIPGSNFLVLPKTNTKCPALCTILMNAMWPCGCPHKITSFAAFVEPRFFSEVHLDPSRIIVSREQHASQAHERDVHTPRTRCACSRLSALSSQAARGVEKSVSYSGPDVYWHHDYPFLVPFTGAASRKCGAFARRMIDARQFIGVPSMQSHASPM